MTRESLQDYFSSSFFIRDSETQGSSFDELLGYYDYSTWDRSYKKTAHFRLKNILKFKRPPGSLLEVGSATGSFLSKAQKAGFSVHGLDVSSTFAQIARKKGFVIDEGFVEHHLFSPSQYDVICSFGGITCWHNPLAALKNIRTALKEDGIFVFNHMDIDNAFHKIQGSRNWDYQHPCLTLWSRKTMYQCLQKAGFDIILNQRERQFVSLGRLLEYFKFPKLRNVVLRLNVDEVAFPSIIPFTRFVVCRPSAEHVFSCPKEVAA